MAANLDCESPNLPRTLAKSVGVLRAGVVVDRYVEGHDRPLADFLQSKYIVLFGWNFNSPIRIGDFTASFYFSYLLLALILLVLSFALVRRLERSWIGLSLDAIRLDEIASACYGLNLARWKVLAFTLGNFLAGTAGAAYGHVLGFIAPNNFTFGDSLILVSIILLGGLGNLWGVAVAAAFVVILPEKFQVIQEYRLVLYAVLVILILLFRPQGLLPRQLRDYVPGAKPQGGRPHAEERSNSASRTMRPPPSFETGASRPPQDEESAR